MYVVRPDVHETNSSSMHSLVITNEGGTFTTQEIRESLTWRTEEGSFECYVYDFEQSFGRSPFKYLYDFYHKLLYAFAEYAYEPEKIAELYAILKEVCPDCTLRFHTREMPVGSTPPEDWSWENKGYEPHIDCPSCKMPVHESYSFCHWCGEEMPDDRPEIPEDAEWEEVVCYGGIDHQSCGILSGFLRTHSLSLKDFLIGKQYIVIIDGDEYGTWGSLKEAGIIDLGKIVEEYPKEN